VESHVAERRRAQWQLLLRQPAHMLDQFMVNKNMATAGPRGPTWATRTLIWTAASARWGALASTDAGRRWTTCVGKRFRWPADPIIFLQPRRVCAGQARRLLHVRAPRLRAVPAGLWWR
jgi:hypothetical protein